MKNVFSCLPRSTLIAILLVPSLLLIDMLCYQITLPLEIVVRHGAITLIVGSTQLAAGTFAPPRSLQFVPHDPLVHEYQIDGSDSVNNRDMDTSYLQQIASSPYYRWQAWMRDLDGTSRWRDLQIEANGHTLRNTSWPGDGMLVPLPNTVNFLVRVQLQRPETPMALNLTLSDGHILQVTLDRNSRQITVSGIDSGIADPIASTFFPVDAAPFAAMFLDTLVRILLWATLLLLAIPACEAGLSLGKAHIPRFARWKRRQTIAQQQQDGILHVWKIKCRDTSISQVWRTKIQKVGIFRALHPIAWLALCGSLIYVIWIAREEYQGQPHIYDASTYFFSAKIYASGHLFAPAPPASALFPGPFMLILNGHWFGQYEPGTALTLVPGIWLHMPWLVEPVLGTLALLGTGLIAARLYDRRVATLAVLLGCLSPFYSYLAASYLSHTIALFYLVWGLWALLRFRQGGAGWHMLICGGCFGMAVLTRDMVALLFVVLLIPGVIILTWKKSKEKRRLLPKWSKWWLALFALGIIFSGFYLGNNYLLTGNLLFTPRNVFFSGDTWGFGQNIGFYGQHTLAAGFVNLDQQLSSLQIDLFGWPFYLTLAFLTMLFLSGRARKADWFLLLLFLVTAGSYIGYFYNGIYLGPRYLFEDLPFLLILSARGILEANMWGLKSGQAARNWLLRPARRATTAAKPAFSLVLVVLMSMLVLCNLLYYTPRQIARYQNYTGLPDLMKLETSQIYQSPVHQAIVVTDDLAIYQLVLFPLNDPSLKGDVIYAWGYTTAQLQELQKDFPGRTLYLLVVYQDGSLHYFRVN